MQRGNRARRAPRDHHEPAALAGVQLALLSWQVLCKQQQGVPAAEQPAKDRGARQLRTWIQPGRGSTRCTARSLCVFRGFLGLSTFLGSSGVSSSLLGVVLATQCDFCRLQSPSCVFTWPIPSLLYLSISCLFLIIFPIVMIDTKTHWELKG